MSLIYQFTVFRSISEYSDFHNLAARSDDYLCNSPDLKRVLQNVRSFSIIISFHPIFSTWICQLIQSHSLLIQSLLHWNHQENGKSEKVVSYLPYPFFYFRFVVLCSPSNQSLHYSLPHEAEFCSSSSLDHSCHIFIDPRHISNF